MAEPQQDAQQLRGVSPQVGNQDGQESVHRGQEQAQGAVLLQQKAVLRGGGGLGAPAEHRVLQERVHGHAMGASHQEAHAGQVRR